jgi:protein-S-isoprenylcysteine O-methyltransferase Ste14
MTPYSIVLFLHIIAMLGLFIALGTELLILSRVSRTVDRAEARAWMRASAISPAVALPSIALILLTGSFLAARTRGWAMAWIQVSLGAMALIGLLGGIAGRRMRAVRQIAANRGASLDAYQRLGSPQD